ncbi:MAG: hypothetical protein GF328_13150 [Candidatus Latescibacteria bacterium]|nr:hypothetical protein [Candidatus Latescibacterota bacterium]
MRILDEPGKPLTCRVHVDSNGKHHPGRPDQALLDRGYVDCFREAHPEDPGFKRDAPDSHTADREPFERVDCILLSPDNPWRPVEVELLRDNLASSPRTTFRSSFCSSGSRIGEPGRSPRNGAIRRSAKRLRSS